MRTETELLNAYQESHQNPLNSLIHVFCVPLIFVTSFGIGWSIPLGRWLGLEGFWGDYLNLATLAIVPVMFFYLRMSVRSTVAMSFWVAGSVAFSIGVNASEFSLFWTSVAIWLVAWAVQVYGHQVEGAKPSFLEDLLFLLVGPMFVMRKLYRKLGMSS